MNLFTNLANNASPIIQVVYHSIPHFWFDWIS